MHWATRSGQIDLVIEYPFFPSFPLLGTSQQRLYLIESVAMAIEVKSGRRQFDDAISTMKRFNALRADADWLKHGEPQPPHEPGRIRTSVRGRGWHTSFPGRTCFAVVLYEGWENAETLVKHCEEGDLDVALQLSPAIFHARKYRYDWSTPPRPKTIEGSALAAFLCVVCEELRSVDHIESNVFRRYIEQGPPPLEGS
jgi:hypothetical protein